jgi:molybdate transport system substrate-binding protein
MKYLISSIVLVALVLGISNAALAQSEVTLLAPRPLMPELEKVIAGFESKTSYKVKATWSSGLGTKDMVAKGEASDVSIMYSPFPEAVASGNVVPGSGKTLAKLVMGVAVQKDAPKPDISTPEALKRTLLAAKSVATVDPAQGSVGASAMAALKNLGIADQVKMKFVPNGGQVQTSVAKGEAEIALGPYVGDIGNPGVDIIGTLSAQVLPPTEVTGFISTRAKDSAAAKALLEYLASSPEAKAVYEAAGMNKK